MAESEQDPSITPLMREVSKGGQARLDQLRIMLSNPEHIATLFMKDSKGRTAIDWARLCRNTDAVAAVKAAMLAEINRSRLSNVQIGADYVTSTLTTNAKLRDELMAALRTRNIGAVSGVLAQNKLRREEVESLGEAFFTDAKDRSGYTPLILAAGQNLFDIVVLLLDMKVPVDNVNKFGHTAFTFSCSGGHASVAIMLLRRGANIHHKTEEGRTGLHYACLYSKVPIVRALIDFYTDKIATDRVLTPLSDEDRGPRWASDADLLEAFVGVRDIYGLMPYDLVPTKTKNMLLATEDAGKLTMEKIRMARRKQLGDDDTGAAAAGSAARSEAEVAGDQRVPVESESSSSLGSDGKETKNVAEKWKQFSTATAGSIASDPNTSIDDLAKSLTASGMDQSHAEEREAASGIVQDVYREEMYAGHNIITDTSLGEEHITPSQQALAKQIEDLFLQVRRRVAHWRSNGRVEDDLMRPMVCPQGCGWQGCEEDLRAHVKMDCSHRKIPCKYCRELHPFIRLSQHETEECELRPVSCPNASIGCTDMVIFNQIKVHLRQKCRVRMVFCRFNCGNKVRCDQMGHHENSECPCRLVTCDQCNCDIMHRDLVNHKVRLCPDRLVICSVSCRRLFKAKEIKHHETKVCVQPCKWKCGRIMGPPEALKLHEMSQCLLRTYDCKNKCGLGGVLGKFVEDHERYQCPRAMVPCTAGCGKQVPREDLSAHCSPWSGSCSERWVRCPSNLVGWKIRLFGPTVPAPSMQTNGGDLPRLNTSMSAPSSASSASPEDGDDEIGSVGIILKYERVLRKSELSPDQRVCISEYFDVSRSTTALASRQIMSPFRPGTNGNSNGRLFTPFDEMKNTGTKLGDIVEEAEGGADDVYCQLCHTGTNSATKDSNDNDKDKSQFSLMEYNWSLKTPIRTTSFGGTTSFDIAPMASLIQAEEKLPRPPKKKIPAYDLALVRLSNCHVWINVWTTDFLLLNKVVVDHEKGSTRDDGKNYECGWIVYGELNGHLQNFCCNRSVWLRGESDRPAAAPEHILKATSPAGTQRPLLSDGATQLAITSGSGTSSGTVTGNVTTTPSKMQLQLRPSSPGAMGASAPGMLPNGERAGQHTRFRDAVVLAETRDNLDGFLIAPAGKTCELCANKLEGEDLKHHSKVCGAVIIRCKFGCGKAMQRLLIKDHVENECSKRPVICPRCGDGETGEIWADELDDHIANFCLKRAAKCPLECGIKDLTAGDVDTHISNHCPRRIVPCTNGCGLELEFCMLHLHVNGDCHMRLHKCTQGCGELLLEKDMSHHCQYLCKFRDNFFARSYKCPLGCGAWIERRDTLEHVSYYCSRRLCECPFTCGISIRFHKLKWHLNYCPNRPICCERGMKVCEQPIKKWFYKVDESAAMTARTTRTSRKNGPGKGTGSGTGSGGTRAALRTSGMGPPDDEEQHTSDRQVVVRYSDESGGQPDQFHGGPVPRFFDGGDDNPAKESENIDDDEDDDGDDDERENDLKSRAASIHSHRKKKGGSKFEQLGLTPCERHHFTALMAAVKQDEFLLAEHILKLTAGNDIDAESKMGDTALIIACRMGKLNFVKLLVENGAEVNYETKTGRTALIETTRARTENIPIVEYLLISGAFAMHKTKTARKTAIDWARQNGKFESLRIMKLSVVVHEQMSVIFRAIGAGDTDKIQKLIGAGTPFKAEDEIKSYEDMEKSIADAREAELEARGYADMIVHELKEKIEKAKEHIEETAVNLQFHEEDLKAALRDQERLGNSISTCYAAYEEAARSLTHADLEEVYRMRTPDDITKIAIFCYGLLFGVLDQRKWLRSVEDMDSDEAKWFLDHSHSSEWWPIVTESLVTNKWVLERIVQYPLDRLLDTGKLATSTSSIKLLRTLSRSASRPTQLTLPDDDKGDSGLSKLGELMLPYRALLVSELKRQAENGGDDFGPGASISLNAKGSTLKSSSMNAANRVPRGDSSTAPMHRQSIRDLKRRGSQSSRFSKSSLMTDNKSVNSAIAGGLKGEHANGDSYFPDDSVSEDWHYINQETLSSTISVRNTVTVRPTSKKRRKDDFDENEPYSDDEEEIMKRSKALPDIPQPASIIVKPGIGGTKSTIVPETEEDKRIAALIAAAEQRALGIATRVTSAKRPRLKKVDPDDEGDVSDVELDDAGIPVPVIPDEDWDSDADEGGVLQGEWVKGEWVPKLRKKPRWWEALKRHKHKAGDDEHSVGSGNLDAVTVDGGGVDAPAEESKGIVPVLETDGNLGSRAAADFGELLLGDEDMESARGSLFSSRYNDNNDDNDADFDNDSVTFYEPPQVDKLNRLVYVVLTLLQAGDSLAHQRCKVAGVNQWVLSRSIARDGAHRANEAARSHLEFAKLTLHQTEYKMVEKMRETKKLLNKSVVFREKLRVIRLLNQVSESGHTAASWAASLGAYNILDLLMQHGAPIGFNVRLTQLSASYLQMSYRLYVLRTKVRRQKQMEEENPELIILAKEKGESSEDGIAKIFNLQDDRARLLGTLRFYRQRIRFPVPEAAYTGKWELIHMLHEREYFHYNFINTWIFPSPPVPYAYVRNRHKYRGEKLSLFTVMAHAMSDLAAGKFTDGFGWVPPGDPREDYGEMQEHLGALMEKVNAKRQAYKAMRQDVRRRNIERVNQDAAKRDMEAAVKAKDFVTCMKIAQSGNASIDHEGADGLTPLLAASEENVLAVDHTYMTNDDGIECLAVAYLLDRDYYRPAVNVENIQGRTALIHACILNRPHVIQALLDRGAIVNRQNKYGNTALHFAAMSGSVETTRLLLERGGDPRIKNNDGISAFEKAESMGLVHILRLISQYNAGFLGEVKVTRGYIVDTVSCPLGCGMQMLPTSVEEHAKVCSCREVDCPLGCGQLRLLAREVDDHIANVCACQPAPCDLCGNMVPARDRRKHMEDLCLMRAVFCPNGCGEEMKAYLVSRHLPMCTQRLMRCPLCCPMQIKVIDASNHLANECDNRRVRCERDCGAKIVAKSMPRHLTDVCPFRPIACEFCGEMVRYREYKSHASHCPEKALPCLNKCGEIIRQYDMKDHVANKCSVRFVKCPNKCPMKFRQTEIEKHLEKDCVNRLVECPLLCYDETLDQPILPIGDDDSNSALASYFVDRKIRKVRVGVLDLHLAHECPNRPIRCGLCTAPLKAYQSESHKISDCGRRIVACRNEGCTKQVPYDERDDHERLRCRFRILPCPQGCGENLVYTRSGRHLQQECINRYIDCPLKCGYRTRFVGMQYHLEEECLRRFGVIDTKSGKNKSSKAKAAAAAVAAEESLDSVSASVPGSGSGPASNSTPRLVSAVSSRSQSVMATPRSQASHSMASSATATPRSQLSSTLPLPAPVTATTAAQKQKPLSRDVLLLQHALKREASMSQK